MYEYCDLSDLYQEVNNGSFINIPETILKLIYNCDGVSFTEIKPINITLEDEIMMEMLWKDQKSDSGKLYDIAFMSNNMRFYINKRSDYKISNIKYSIKSGIDKDKINNFSTFFIGINNWKEEYDNILIGSIVFSKMSSILSEKYNINATDLAKYIPISDNIINSDFINATRSLIDIYICLFRSIDKYLNLRYDNFEDFIETFKDIHYYDIYLVEIMKKSYEFAITTNNNPGDYDNLVKNSCKSLYKLLKIRELP